MLYVLAAFVLLVMVAWMVLQPLLGRDQSVADAEVADLEALIAERRRRMAAAEKEVQP